MTKHQIVKSTLRRLRSIYSNLQSPSKSDKINALRKQYDAFLEEDKKRKDRNEYILGRMETMRSCTALVHVRSKTYPKTEESDYPAQPKYKRTVAHISNSTIALSGRHNPKYFNKNFDEPTVLREISKKYFLIPKVVSDDFYNVKLKHNDRNPSPTDDWKSKYNILEELKREENEDQSNKKYETQNNLNDPYEDNKNVGYIPQESNEKSIVEKNDTSLELTPSKLQTDMFSNKEVSYNNLEVKPNQGNEKQIDKTFIGMENIGDLNMKKQELVPQSNKSHEVNLPAHSSLPKVSQVENNIKPDTTLYSTNDKINEFKDSNELREDKLTSKKDSTDALENNKYVPEEKKVIEFNESQNTTGQNTLNNANISLSPIVNNENTMEVNNENTMEVNNVNTVEVNNVNTMDVNNVNTMEVNNENNAFSAKNIADNQQFVHTENTVRAQGVYEEDAGHLQDDPAIDITGHQEYQLQETDLNQIPNVEQNVTSEVNDELETEQNEMFYSEDKDNEYNEHDSTTCQAENENYVNQEYSYYDESQKEQAYPTEINEHEEATERYDPNYEQQYVNNYDNTMNTQYQPEQYTVENSYDQQQNMYDHQQGDVNYQAENPNYEYAPMESVTDAEPNQNVYYTNPPQENAQYEVQQVENSEIDQQNVAYTTSEDYDAQQEYITMQAEPLQIENVEQQLDIEDGYIPNPNILAENQDYEEQIIEETIPVIPEPDFKVT